MSRLGLFSFVNVVYGNVGYRCELLCEMFLCIVWVNVGYDYVLMLVFGLGVRFVV